MQTTSISLLAQAQALDNEAWSRLYALYEPLIRIWVLRDPIARDETEDLAHDVLLAVHENLPSFERQRSGSFRKWLRVIATNQVNEYLRKRRPQVAAESLFEKLVHPTNELEEEWNAEYDRHVIRKLLAMIEPEFGEQTWQIFALTEFDGVGAPEVAKRFNVSQMTVYMARNRVLARLREVGAEILEN